jgi:hypothetical protein
MKTKYQKNFEFDQLYLCLWLKYRKKHVVIQFFEILAFG